MDSIPPITKIFSLMVQQERHMTNLLVSNSNVVNPIVNKSTVSVTLILLWKNSQIKSNCYRKNSFPSIKVFFKNN